MRKILPAPIIVFEMLAETISFPVAMLMLFPFWKRARHGGRNINSIKGNALSSLEEEIGAPQCRLAAKRADDPAYEKLFLAGKTGYLIRRGWDKNILCVLFGGKNRKRCGQKPNQDCQKSAPFDARCEFEKTNVRKK